MRSHLFWVAVLGFLVGVFVRSFLPLGWYAGLFVLLLAGALFLLTIATRRTPAIILGVALASSSVGVVRMHVSTLVLAPELHAQLEKKVTLEGYIFEEPDARESNARFSIRVDTLVTRAGTTAISAGVLAIGPLHASVEYGDRVRAEGELRLPESFESGTGREFNYPAYLKKDGIGYELAFAQIEKIGEGRQNPIKAGAIWIKQIYLAGIALALPEPHAGLAGGITAGDKRALGGELTDIFRTVGLIHIIVLSGYNIMVVIGFIDRIFSPRPVVLKVFGGAHRWVRFSLGILVAIFFALITGLAAASVRAAAMAIIAILGKASGRTYLALRALALVAFGMVLWNPWILAFDPGFQLSIIATWGIISISPLIASRLGFVTERLGLREIAATTIGTQIAVLPLLLYQSGTLSLVSLPANLLTLIVVPWAMLASFIAGVFGILAGPLAPIVGFPAYVLLSYILFVADLAARLPFASISVGIVGFWVLVLSYALIGAVFAKREK